MARRCERAFVVVHQHSGRGFDQGVQTRPPLVGAHRQAFSQDRSLGDRKDTVLVVTRGAPSQASWPPVVGHLPGRPGSDRHPARPWLNPTVAPNADVRREAGAVFRAEPERHVHRDTRDALPLRNDLDPVAIPVLARAELASLRRFWRSFVGRHAAKPTPALVHTASPTLPSTEVVPISDRSSVRAVGGSRRAAMSATSTGGHTW